MTSAQNPPIGLFYGSSTCYTEMAAEKIRDALGGGRVQMFNIADTPIVQAQLFDYLVMGIPTWDFGELQEDWEEIWPDLDELNLSGKKVAVFGLGDQIGYPEWFVDAMGYLHNKLVDCGAEVVGYWPNQGYSFETSKALTADQHYFVGLALDEENEFELSEQRINTWCAQILREFGLQEQLASHD